MSDFYEKNCSSSSSCDDDELQRKKSERKKHFSDLPRELQLQIFSFLSRTDLITTAALVCRDWFRLTRDPVLWKSLNFNLCKEDVDVGACQMMQHSSMLRKLKIRTYFSLEKLASCSHSCPMLKHLDLGFCPHVDSQVLSIFAKHCPLLETLNVEGCDKIEQKAISSIVGMRKLRVLNLSHCIFVDNECLRLLAESVRNLENLNVDGITRIDDSSICTLADKLKSNLVRLILDGEDLTDSAFKSISQCKKLVHLSISFGELLTDKSLFFVRMLTALEKLKFKRTLHMTTNAINSFFVGHHVNNLVTLELDTVNIDDEGICNITQNCKLLRLLSLPWCWEVTEVGLEHIVKHCHSLRYLDLLGLYRLTGLCLLSIHDNLKELEYLNLEQCNDILDSILIQLVIRIPKLKVFNYYGELVLPDSCSDC